MAKRLSDNQKEEIIKDFINGKTIQELSEKFCCTKLTISRNLKKNFGEKNYKDLINKSKSFIEPINGEENLISSEGKGQLKQETLTNKKNSIKKTYDEFSPETTFFEIAPLDLEIDNEPQKDLSSIPIKDLSFPKIVYMIVDNKIELITKLLRDYPEWQFLSNDDQSRKTLKIYFDLKIAKRDCNKEQKVIKIPNPEVFKIVAPILVSRGISRIVCVDQLISL